MKEKNKIETDRYANKYRKQINPMIHLFKTNKKDFYVGKRGRCITNITF